MITNNDLYKSTMIMANTNLLKQTSTLNITAKISLDINPVLRVVGNIQVWVSSDKNDNMVYDEIEVIDIDQITYMDKLVTGPQLIEDFLSCHKQLGVDVWEILQDAGDRIVRGYSVTEFVRVFSDFQCS